MPWTIAVAEEGVIELDLYYKKHYEEQGLFQNGIRGKQKGGLVKNTP